MMMRNKKKEKMTTTMTMTTTTTTMMMMMMMIVMMMLVRSTLGVSTVLCNHWLIRPATVWSNSYLHRTAYQMDVASSSRSPNQALSERFTNASQCGLSSARHSAIRHSRQPSYTQDPHVYQRRLLHLLVSVRDSDIDAGVGQLVPAAVCSRVHSNVACKRQQCCQRVHLFFDKHAV